MRSDLGELIPREGGLAELQLLLGRRNFKFTGFKKNETTGPPYDGVMFYSTDPASHGYVLTSDGHTIRKSSAAGDSTAGATASPTATTTASPTALATTDGSSVVWPLTLVAALALVAGSGVTALALLRRGFS